jgi:hypothetical protein
MSDRTALPDRAPEPGEDTRAGPDAFHRRLHQVRPTGLSAHTAQTEGMLRVEALSGPTVGTERLWMGQTHVAPSTRSANHHHGLSGRHRPDHAGSDRGKPARPALARPGQDLQPGPLLAHLLNASAGLAVG